MENSSRYFKNEECEYFPCHEIEDGEDFNCLFCYCPLHSLGESCGGNFEMIPNPSGGEIKSCMDCKYPHNPKSYDEIIVKLYK